MTLHRLGAGDGYRYLTDQVAGGDGGRAPGQSLGDYYQATGNPAGRWVGTGADVLGVEGAVSTGQMHNLYGLGLHPETGKQLGRRYLLFRTIEERVRARVDAAAKAGTPLTAEQLARVEHQELAKGEKQAVAGFDCVFSPVKSVSLAWALTEDPAVTAEVEAAHHAAVEHVIGWIERDVAFARVGAGGVAQVDVAGVAAACFDHRTSRAGDPDLHTHAVISNKALARLPDGTTKWLTLDSQSVYRAGVAASERYNRVLEDEITRRLGWRFEPRVDQDPTEVTAIREIVGMPLDLIRGFSARRTQVEAAYAGLIADYHRQHGHTPPRGVQYELAQQATLMDRPAKRTGETVGEERARWAEQAAGMLDRVNQQRLSQLLLPGPLVGLRTSRDVSVVEVGEIAASTLADVTARRSTWTVRHVQAAAQRATRDLTMASPEARDQLIARVVTAVLTPSAGISDARRLDPPEIVAPPPELRRAGGESVFIPHASERYTTEAQLEAEDRLLAHARRVDAPAIDAVHVELAARHAENTGMPLTSDQLLAVTALATSGHGVGLLIGPAGTGKTSTVRALVRAWQQQPAPHRDLEGWAAGPRVFGLAPTAVAAAVLKAETGMPATETIHSWQAGDSDLLTAGDLLVVDEAGMVGTGRLLDVIDRAAEVGAKVVLVGDHRQLGAIESGGALRLLGTDAPDAVAELNTVWRFADVAPDGTRSIRQWEADASLQVRVGDTAGLEPYFTHDRVQAGAEAVMVDALYGRWRASETAGHTAIMVAASVDTVAELGRRARADRVAEGQVEAEGVALADGNLAGVGDVVVTRRNNRLLAVGKHFVKNGDLWRVLERKADGALTVQSLAHGGQTTLPYQYVCERVEQGYAMTVHRAQGSTVDDAHVLVDGTWSRELLYVAMTRGRRGNDLYVAADHVLDVDAERPPPPTQLARAVLADVLAKETGDRSATETLRDAYAHADNLRTLLPRYRFAAELCAGDRARDVIAAAVTPAAAARATGSPGWPALATRIDLLEERGVDVARELAASVNDRGVDDAADTAAVLHARLTPAVVASRPVRGDWLPPAPAADGELPAYLRELREAMDSRTDQLGAAAVAERPDWVAAVPAAARPDDQVAWEQVIARVAAYREAFRVHGPDPLGPLPDEPRQVEAHAHLRSSIDALTDNWARRGSASTTEAAARLDAARRRMAVAEGDYWKATRFADDTPPAPPAERQLRAAALLLEQLDAADAAQTSWEQTAHWHAQASGDLARARAEATTGGRRDRREAAARVARLQPEVERAGEARDTAAAHLAAAQRGLPADAARQRARVDARRTVDSADQLRARAAAEVTVRSEAAAEHQRAASAAYTAAREELSAAEASARAAGVRVDAEEMQSTQRRGRDLER